MKAFKNHPMSVFGFNVNATTPGYEQRSDMVPDLDPDYVFEKESLTTLRMWWMKGQKEPLYIFGPQGSGKTSLVEQFLARLNVPVIPIMGRDPMEKADLVGMPWLGVDGAMHFRYGPATRAYGHGEDNEGCVLLVNEFTKCDPGFWVANNELLERKPIYVEQTGELIKPKAGFRLVVTDNIRGLVGDDTGMFQRRFRQDASVMDRFWAMEMKYIARDDEIALLMKGLTGIGADVAKRFAETLRDVAEDVRKAWMGNNSGSDAIETTLSTRTLLRIRDLFTLHAAGVKQGIDPVQKAFEIALTTKCDPVSRAVIDNIVKLRFGNQFKPITPAPAQAVSP
jgi:cobaltochelatase CobS